MPPRKVTWERSGSLREASPLADSPADSASAATGHRRRSGRTTAKLRIRRPKDAAVAIQVHIGESSDMKVSRDLKVFPCLLPAGAITRTLQWAPGKGTAGVPNTLPLQGMNRSAELGRVGFFVCAGSVRNEANHSPNAVQHKTGVYSMPRKTGQTHESRHVCCGL